MTVTVVSLCVGSVLTRWEQVELFLNQINADILCLQVCGIPGGKEYSRFESRWKWELSFWSGTNENRAAGVAILIRNPETEVARLEEVVCGRLLHLTPKVKETVVEFSNVCTPAERDVNFFNNIGN